MAPFPTVLVHFNPFPPGPTKTALFIILLCLTPDDLIRQGRTSGWETLPSLPSQMQKNAPRSLFHSHVLTHQSYFGTQVSQNYVDHSIK